MITWNTRWERAVKNTVCWVCGKSKKKKSKMFYSISFVMDVPVYNGWCCKPCFKEFGPQKIIKDMLDQTGIILKDYEKRYLEKKGLQDGKQRIGANL